ncbi:MAG: hypothetical protein LBM25_04250 [Bacteroidales bacterium]|jgi:hypothetical protein|nr:hypothetical protein [Bacteroidales bacterium]
MGKINVGLFIIIFVFILPISLFCQTPEQINKQISSIEESEMSSQSKQTLIEDLIRFQNNPININAADENDLRTIGLTDFQIKSLKRYIKETKELISLYELPLINGFDEETIKQITPYIYVGPKRWSPSLRLDSIFLRGKGDIRLQYKNVLEKTWGFQRMDDGGFQGGDFATSLKYNFDYYDKISFSLVAENDEGEPFFTKGQTMGFDFLAGQFTIKNLSIIEQITIGNYRLGFAEGLAMNQHLNFGYFSNDAKSSKNYNGIKPNRSAIEDNSMRGIATKINLSNFSLYLFASYNKIDYGGTILSTGLHRTQSEISKKDSNRETIFGSHLLWTYKGFSLGGTYFHYQYKYPIKHRNIRYMQYYFEGDKNDVYSLNSSITLPFRSRLFGEVAMSKNGGGAFIVGLETNIAYKTNFTINYRNYQNKYQNAFSSALGVQSRNANERGLYSAISYRITDKWNVFLASDFFRIPDISYNASSSVKGYKARLEVNFSPNVKHLLNFYYKLSDRPYDEDHLNDEVYPESNILQQWQLHYTFFCTDYFSLKTRVGYSNTRTYSTNANNGQYISQDINFHPNKFPIDIKLRLAVFSTNDYDNAFYVYEYSLPQNYYTSQLYDKGFRSYIVIRYNITKNMYLAGRYSITYYTEKTTIHSANDMIQGKKIQEIGLQYYWMINPIKKSANPL